MLVQKPTSAFDTGYIPISSIPIPRSTLTQEALERYPIALMSGVRNADGTVLDATGASTKFKIVPGGYGSGTLTLQGQNARSGATASQTDTLCFEFTIPPEYDDSADVKLVVHCSAAGGGTVGTKTLDAQVYELSDSGTVGSDICATTIQTITTSFADYTFTITDAGLVGGDRLIVFVQTVITETGGSSDKYASIGSIEIQMDIKG